MVTKKFIGVLLAGVWAMMGLWAAVQEQAEDARPMVLEKAPIRVVEDPYATFQGIAVNEERDEVIVTDDNHGAVLTYAGQFNPSDRMNEPRRRIGGPKSEIGMICSVAFSPERNEIYTVDNDTGDHILVFPLDGNGEVAPLRELKTDHGAWGLFLDEKNDEVVITVQHGNKVVVYRSEAEAEEMPLRVIHGPNTELADPHGLDVDLERNEIFVANHGNWQLGESGFGLSTPPAGGSEGTRSLGPSTGKFLPPSITVYSRTATGDVAPLRTIQGSKTGLNWPHGVVLDRQSGQIAVANTGDNSILFFDRSANGDVAPVRVIRGPATGLDGPTQLTLDTKRQELWITNWNNHTASVYPRAATGNVAPLRRIRSAPASTPRATGFGNPGDVVFDSKRGEILIPN
jgi:DNA-binding beta-propeller fold protein YncE